MTQITVGRTCGECTACCLTHTVAEVQTVGGEWCKHCDHGCKIYPTRPEECRLYKCGWLEGKGRDDDRPDKSGFVMNGADIEGQKAGLLIMWEATPGGLDTDRAIQVAKAALDQGYVVAFHLLAPGADMVIRFPWQMDDAERQAFIVAFNKHYA